MKKIILILALVIGLVNSQQNFGQGQQFPQGGGQFPQNNAGGQFPAQGNAAGQFPGQGGAGQFPQAGGGQFPGQAGAGQFPGQGGQGAPGQFPGQGGVGQFPGQGGAGQFPGQGGAGQFPGQGGAGQFPGQGGAGQFPGQGGAGQFPGQGGPGGAGQFPGQGGAGQFPGQGGAGQFPGQGGPGGAGQFPGQGGPGGPGQFPGQPGGQFNNVGGFQNPFGGVGNFLGGNDGTFGGGAVNGLPGQGTAPNAPFTAGGQFFMNLSQNPNNYRYATCYFNSTESSIKGRADFRQFLYGNPSVDIRIQVVGLPPSPVDTQRGVHIHDFGDIGDRCSRVGPHYNPTQTRHGGRNSFPFLRHVGDLGNMLQSKEGVSSTQFTDSVVALAGQNSIIGRSLVIKLERDDEGTGTNSASQMNGNARTPLACCTIGRASSSNWAQPYSEQDLAALSGGVFIPTNINTAPTQPAQGNNNGLSFGVNTNTNTNPVAPTNTVNQFNPQPNPNFNQPTNTQFNQPANTQFNQPANPQLNQPANPQFNQPANPQFNQPANPQFNQPAAGINQPVNQPPANNAAGGGGNPFFGMNGGAQGGGGGAQPAGSFNFLGNGKRRK